jgi:hypothetical protein
MYNETNQTGILVAPPSATKNPSGTASLWRHLPTIAKCIVVVPLAMALLGTEIELRLSPQLDVLLTAAGVWGIWAWLTGNTPPLI